MNQVEKILKELLFKTHNEPQLVNNIMEFFDCPSCSLEVCCKNNRKLECDCCREIQCLLMNDFDICSLCNRTICNDCIYITNCCGEVFCRECETNCIINEEELCSCNNDSDSGDTL